MIPTFNFFCFLGLYFWLFTLYLVFYFWLFKFGTWLFSCDFISGVFSLWSFAFAISLGVRSSIACWPGKSLTFPLPLPRLQFLLFAFLYFCPVFISFVMQFCFFFILLFTLSLCSFSLDHCLCLHPYTSYLLPIS